MINTVKKRDKKDGEFIFLKSMKYEDAKNEKYSYQKNYKMYSTMN